ncbi:MAG: M4 family metallopeptidase [Verrucomicrobiota bacterium]
MRNSKRSAPKFNHCPVCTIIPPHMLEHLAQHCPADQRECMFRTLQLSERLRGQRDMLAFLGGVMLATPTGTKRRTIYDAENGTKLPGALVRDEGDPAGQDLHVNEAYDYSGVTYDFFKQIFARISIDGNGMRLDSTVHYSRDYANAFWNGVQMVYGDGDGVIFERFTKSLDVIAHELAHGVTQFEAGLAYFGQPGALNESFSDVFGSLVKQWSLQQTALQADWLIGAGLFKPGVKGSGIRSMKAPGTAYDDPRLGKDPQPAHMRDYYDGLADNGGVHINSGIPNRAFYLVATALGGFSWEKAGRIWYDTLSNRIGAHTNFQEAAQATLLSAGNLFGDGSEEQRVVEGAWRQVGVL